MKRIDKFKSMSVDEIAEYIATNWVHDNDPTITWFDNEYCTHCQAVEEDYAYCEMYGKCEHFLNLNRYPNNKDIVKVWLESEC